jgi:enamine deaminase RidA (YjgF/YER057c/UK114 family)
MAVRARDRVYLRGQTGTTFDGEFTGLGDPAAHEDQAMRNVKQLLEEAGAGLDDICKVTTFITDRAFREPAYQTIGRHLKGVHPVGTGLIVDGLAHTRLLVEIDVEAVIQS